MEEVTTTEKSTGHKILDVLGCTGGSSLTNGILTLASWGQEQIYDEGSIGKFRCASGYLVDPDLNYNEAEVRCTAIHNPDGSVGYRWKFPEFPNSKGCTKGTILILRCVSKKFQFVHFITENVYISQKFDFLNNFVI